MFVVEGLNVSEQAPDVDRVCSVAGCDPDSLLNQVPPLGPGWLAGQLAGWLAELRDAFCSLNVILAA